MNLVMNLIIIISLTSVVVMAQAKEGQDSPSAIALTQETQSEARWALRQEEQSQAITDDKEEKVEFKHVTGEVVFLSSGMITIEYSQQAGVAREILIPVGKEAVFVHLNNMKDIQRGDTVTVLYKETYIEDEEGSRSNFKRLATKISLVKRAIKGLRAVGQ
jgi:hypothetical protein